eukprot:COSAG01_NODE_24_length_37608_cov_19.303154_33_plen_91_part_00
MARRWYISTAWAAVKQPAQPPARGGVSVLSFVAGENPSINLRPEKEKKKGKKEKRIAGWLTVGQLVGLDVRSRVGAREEPRVACHGRQKA